MNEIHTSYRTSAMLQATATPTRSDASYLVQNSRRLDSAQFRVIGRTDKLNRAGQACSRLELGNLSGTATAFINHDAFLLHQRDVHHGDVVLIKGALHDLGDRFVICIDKINKPVLSSLRPTALLPKEWVLPEYIPQLRTVMRHWIGIKSPTLQRFMTDTFMDSSTAMGFLNVQASQRYHHAYQCGLLDHTADMLINLDECMWLNGQGYQKDIAVVLVILHDIGKIVTLVGRGRADRGSYQPHEMAALEMLAVPLTQLEMTDPISANLIRGFFKPRDWYPQKRDKVYGLVSSLDRQSANFLIGK